MNTCESDVHNLIKTIHLSTSLDARLCKTGILGVNFMKDGMNSVVHFEIPVEDMARAEKFYANAFGWIMKPEAGMDYTIVVTGELDSKNRPKQPGYINGGMMKRTNLFKNPIVTIGVIDIDKALASAEKNGGKIVANKTKVGEYGYSAYVKDTEGNIVGLWQVLMKM
jgi:predicted enzyme related to lactoylglutathione lyase